MSTKIEVDKEDLMGQLLILSTVIAALKDDKKDNLASALAAIVLDLGNLLGMGEE